MIVLDTNVLSEILKPDPDEDVGRRLRQLKRADTFTTVVCLAEILLGLAILPSGKRKAALSAAISAMFREEFAGRILSYDPAAAAHYADILARRRSSGRPISTADAQIAAIVRHASATLCSRNTRDFEGCGIRVWDPWRADLDRAL